MRLSNDQIASLTMSFKAQQLKALQLADAGIHAIAIGKKRKGDAQEATLDDAIIFFVEKKEPPDMLPPSRRIPSTLPVMIDGQRVNLETDVVEESRFEFAGCTTGRPTRGGNCVAPARSGISGTLGGVVIDPQGQAFIVSASHVLTNYGSVPTDHPICHPHTGTAIATLDSRGVRWPRRPGPMGADVALAKITVATDVDGQHIEGIGTPTGHADPQIGDRVTVIGSCMGEPRSADITEMVALSDVRQLRNDYTYEQMFVTPRISERSGGDSGALAVNAKTGKVVGLLFAHNGKKSLFATMEIVRTTLGIDETWSWGVSREVVDAPSAPT